MNPKLMAAALAVLIAGPALAQAAPPPPAGARTDAPRDKDFRRHHGERMFPGVSAEGRQTLLTAFRDPGDKASRDQIRAARDRVAALLSADELDTGALRKAMDSERALIDAQQKARQERMITAYQKLSPADRKAFVADARAGRDRMEKRMGEMHRKKAERAPAQK